MRTWYLLDNGDLFTITKNGIAGLFQGKWAEPKDEAWKKPSLMALGARDVCGKYVDERLVLYAKKRYSDSKCYAKYGIVWNGVGSLLFSINSLEWIDVPKRTVVDEVLEDLDKISRLDKPLGKSKYHKEIKSGVFVDVYDVLNAYEVTDPATQHAIKKLLMPGQRGHKDGLKDLQEAKMSIERAIVTEEERVERISKEEW